jgi:hypothetical protein
MVRLLLFSIIVLVATACGREADIAPTLTNEVAGQYQTNGFLDYLCIALPPEKMPSVTIAPETDGQVTLTYLRHYPTTQRINFTNVALARQPDGSIQLMQAGIILGNTRTDRAFNSNGLERQALVLRIARPGTNGFTFTGSK